jgi:hypothetical protein
MKSFQKTLLFAAFVIGLAVFSYFVIHRGSERDEERKQKAALLLQVAPEQVVELNIERKDGALTLQKEGAEWKLNQPVTYSADRGEVESLVNALLSEKSLQVVREGAGIDWKIYGLDQPEGTVILKFQDGSQKKLAIGSRRTYDNDLYLRFDGEEKVHLVEAAWSGYLHRDAKSLRDKRVLKETVQNITAFTIENKDGTVSKAELTAKDAGGWAAEKSAFDVDQETAQEWIKGLEALRATDFVAEDKANFKNLGKAMFSAVLEFKSKDPKDPKARTKVALDFYAQENNYNLVTSEFQPVFRITKSALDQIKFYAGDFRDKKKPFAFKAGDVVKVQYRSSLFNAQIEKISQGQWTLRAGGKEGDAVVSSEMENLIKTLSGLQATEFVPISQVKGAGKNQITLRDGQDRELFSIKWGDEYKAQKRGNPMDLIYVVTNLEKEGMGVDSAAIKAIPGQTLLAPKAANDKKDGASSNTENKGSSTVSTGSESESVKR